MQRNRVNYKYINYVFSFTLIIVFALLMALLIYSSVNSFKKVKEHTDLSFNSSTAMGYIVNKIHGNDSAGVTLGEKEDVKYISLGYEVGGYVTYVYCYDGKLYECLSKKDSEFVPGRGEIICDIESMTIEEEEDLLHIVLTSDEQSEEAYVYINSTT